MEDDKKMSLIVKMFIGIGVLIAITGIVTGIGVGYLDYVTHSKVKSAVIQHLDILKEPNHSMVWHENAAKSRLRFKGNIVGIVCLLKDSHTECASKVDHWTAKFTSIAISELMRIGTSRGEDFKETLKTINYLF